MICRHCIIWCRLGLWIDIWMHWWRYCVSSSHALWYIMCVGILYSFVQGLLGLFARKRRDVECRMGLKFKRCYVGTHCSGIRLWW